MSFKYCPKCKSVIPPGNDHCNCGWNQRGKNKTSQRTTQAELSGTCEWEHEGRRCPEVGAHSRSTKGGGPWYCWPHLNSITISQGLEIIDDYEKNGIRVRKSPSHVMMENSEKFLDKVPRGKNESAADYARRVMSIVLGKVKPL